MNIATSAKPAEEFTARTRDILDTPMPAYLGEGKKLSDATPETQKSVLANLAAHDF